MDSRLFFIFGDLLSAALVGAAVAALTSVAFGPQWNMWLAMFVAMALGMLAAFILWLPLGMLFGAMEVMVPTMLTGMLVAMVIGMQASMQPLSLGTATGAGALLGFACIAATWLANSLLRGNMNIEAEKRNG